MTMNFEAHYEREGITGWPIKSWEDANKLLGHQKTEGPSYTVFTISNGSYVQCAGGKTELTVEARVIEQGGSFKHFRFGKGKLSGRQVEIECSCGPIKVDETQALKMKDARLIVRHFVESNGELLSGYEAQDISNVFQ
jgi:hypothetical protein